jgi:hypothetical protein
MVVNGWGHTMILGRARLVLSLLTCALAVGRGLGAEPTVAELRERVVKADTPDKKAEAYKAYFLKVGRAGLKDLMKDEDTSIALQAAWEAHLKPVKRNPEIRNRADDVYDPAELKRFVAFLKERTKAPVPDWWAAAVADVDLFPGYHHAFVSETKANQPKRHRSKAGALVPDGAELEVSGDNLVYSRGGRSVGFRKGEDDLRFHDRFAGVLGKDRSAVAAFGSVGGKYKLFGFGAAGAGVQRVYSADVWGSGRTGLATGVHDHWAELAEGNGAVYVFGAESHGMYMEAFDAATGTARFRFCTCYWWHWSEGWGLK